MNIFSRYLLAVLVIAFFSQNTFAQTGHVGVGEAAPQARLHVTQSDPSTSNGILGLFQRNGAGDVGLSFSQKDVSSYAILHPVGGGLAFYKDRSPSSAGTLSMRLSNDGDLFLAGGRSLYVGEQTNLGGEGLRFHHAINRGWIDYSGPFGLHFRINQGNGDATRMFIRSLDGHVGIGTTNPGEKLTVVSPLINSTVASFRSSGGFGRIQVDNGNPFAVLDLGVLSNKTGFLGTRHGTDLHLRTFSRSRMTITGLNGNVGIGTEKPINILDVNGGVAIGAAYSGSSTAPADGALIQGYVGIGTIGPRAPLHVAGVSFGNTGTYIRYFNDVTAFITTFPNWTGQATIYAEGNICSTEAFIAGQSFNFSDARIKNIIGRSDGAADLDRLNRIEITRYTHIDTLAKGKAVQTKVIAQQLEQVMPEAVSYTREFIPDVMQVAEQLDFRENENLLTITLSQPHRLQVGDHLKCFDEKGQELLLEVSAVPNDKAVAFQTDQHPTRLFVYGKQVDDFHIVDYDAISMLNVSATQELARRLAASEQSATQLRAEVEALKAKLSEMEALKKQMARLEAMLEGQ
ncbi:tail fiber domain-containing protein [Flavilitoribacter nigricans]|uniref:Peptidase S74 domain-containing protein n=1 Tax=Flavilitoribacter nigricans (strain ATCC 23147 / DSM 23189 / NBRC 102662 / NCIMB 1420 / SS-2) TaxID=1122177 RepID=A0A2D0N237_FLAN2|nr:tail fiber domain-containing protein [Flavilitoribacter nigricans]PHN02565.1 hypothetical protein CRP01_31820 [Flavilitoribacter nigricans DSM 23189 = NBRC 102662]